MLDDEGILLLDDDKQTTYYAYQAMFNTQGWKLLLREWAQEKNNLRTRGFDNAENYEQVLAGRAAEKKINELLNWEAQIAARQAADIESAEYEAEAEAAIEEFDPAV